MYKRYGILIVLTMAMSWGVGASADNVARASHGTVYVPASWQQLPFTTPVGGVNQYIVSRLIIRNTDMNDSITLNSVRFHGPEGELVHEFVTDPITLSALSSTSFLANTGTLGIPAYTTDGGRPSFIVEWGAPTKVNMPIIENLQVVVQGELVGVSLHGMSITPGQRIR